MHRALKRWRKGTFTKMHSIVNVFFVYSIGLALLAEGAFVVPPLQYHDRSRTSDHGTCEHWKNFPKETTPKVPYQPFECPDPDNDDPSGHFFLVSKHEDSDTIYGNHFSILSLPPHWYHAVATFKFLEPECRHKVFSAVRPTPGHFLTIFPLAAIKLVDFLSPRSEVNVGFGFTPLVNSIPDTQLITECKMEVKEVIELRRFPRENLAAVPFPGDARYLLYGDRKYSYISHICTKCLDYEQVIRVSNLPLRFRKKKRTAVIRLPNIPGRPRPVLSENKLTEQRYKFYTEDKPLRLHRFTIKEILKFDAATINIQCPAASAP